MGPQPPFASGRRGRINHGGRRPDPGSEVHEPAEQRVAGERRERRLEIGEQRRRAGGEAADEQPRVDDEPLDAGARRLEHGEHRRGVEAVDPEGERRQRVGVEADQVVLAQPPEQLGVHRGRVVELQLVVVVARPARAHGAAPQQHGPAHEIPALTPPRPRRHPGGEEAGVDAAITGELSGGRAQRPGAAAGGTVHRSLTEEHRQRGRPSGEQRRQAGRVRVCEVQGVLAGVARAEQGVRQARRRQRLPPGIRGTEPGSAVLALFDSVDPRPVDRRRAGLRVRPGVGRGQARPGRRPRVGGRAGSRRFRLRRRRASGHGHCLHANLRHPVDPGSSPGASRQRNVTVDERWAKLRRGPDGGLGTAATGDRPGRRCGLRPPRGPHARSAEPRPAPSAQGVACRARLPGAVFPTAPGTCGHGVPPSPHWPCRRRCSWRRAAARARGHRARGRRAAPRRPPPGRRRPRRSRPPTRLPHAGTPPRRSSERAASPRRPRRACGPVTPSSGTCAARSSASRWNPTVVEERRAAGTGTPRSPPGWRLRALGSRCAPRP